MPPCSQPMRTPSGASHSLNLRQCCSDEDLGRRHDRRLPAGVDRGEAGDRRDDRLAAADVALQQALHRVRLAQVAQHFVHRRGSAHW